MEIWLNFVTTKSRKSEVLESSPKSLVSNLLTRGLFRFYLYWLDIIS